MFGRGQVCALFFQPRHDGLEITETSGQPINARHDEGFIGMDKIQNGIEFWAAFEARTAFLFLADHGASSRFKCHDLRIKVLIGGRCAGVSDFGHGFVHFGCAEEILCSIYRRVPKLHIFCREFLFTRAVHIKCTLFDILDSDHGHAVV